jgi:hypothetical protein
MKRWAALFLLLLLPALPAAEASLASARQARQMLGPAGWACVLRIENTNPRSSYPAEVYATVFEFDNILWFYTETDGTRSLSRQLGRLAEDKADLQPLLKRIDPGFTRFEPVPDTGVQFASARSHLPNGCFIDSVVALQESFDAGVPLTHAALLSYYTTVNGRRRGHTVLVYETPDGCFFVDRARSRRARPVGLAGIDDDALVVARAVHGAFAPRQIERARWVGAVVPTARLAPAYVDAPTAGPRGAVAG